MADDMISTLAAQAARIAELEAEVAMPRPEPGSAEEDAMVERAARAWSAAILEIDHDERTWDDFSEEDRAALLRTFKAALRAALGTGDAER